MDSINPSGPNEVQAFPIENGYSLAIVALTVLMVESAISRTQYRMDKIPPQKTLEFIKAHFLDDLVQKVIEIFVLRDVIAHNHVWEAKFFWDEHGKMKLVEAEITEGYGDRKFNKTVDSNTRKTKMLELNVFPNRICRSDAVKVLKTAFDFLLALENKNQNYFSVSALEIKSKGFVIPFTQFMSELK